MDNDEALSAITRAFTEDEAHAIVDRFVAANPDWDGAHADDILETLDATDAHLAETEPFYEAHRGELPDVPGRHYAMLAVIRMGRDLTVPAVLDLLERAGIAETMTVTVRDRSAESPWGVGLTQPVTRQVTISAYCPQDGQRRGEPRGLNQADDGAHYWVQVWANPCGHTDMYEAVIEEARARGGLGAGMTH